VKRALAFPARLSPERFADFATLDNPPACLKCDFSHHRRRFRNAADSRNDNVFASGRFARQKA